MWNPLHIIKRKKYSDQLLNPMQRVEVEGIIQRVLLALFTDQRIETYPLNWDHDLREFYRDSVIRALRRYLNAQTT